MTPTLIALCQQMTTYAPPGAVDEFKRALSAIVRQAQADAAMPAPLESKPAKARSVGDGPVMTFGKYAGKPLSELDDGYLQWLIRTTREKLDNAGEDYRFRASDSQRLLEYEAELRERRVAR